MRENKEFCVKRKLHLNTKSKFLAVKNNRCFNKSMIFIWVQLRKKISNLNAFLFGATLIESFYIEKNEKEINKQIYHPIKFGLIAVIITVAFFFIWSGFAPLDSAAIAEGYIKLNHNRKTIQHYEGGVVKKILVKDGDEVKKGDVLLVLNQAKTNSELLKTLWQINYDILVEERIKQLMNILMNVRNNIKFNPNKMKFVVNSNYLFDYENLIEQDFNELLKTQGDLFDTFKKSIFTRVAYFYAQMKQNKSEIEIFKYKLNNFKALLHISKKELVRRKKLYKERLETLDNVAREETSLHNLKAVISECIFKLRGLYSKRSEIESSFFHYLDHENLKLADDFKRNKVELLYYKSIYVQVKDSYERSVIKAPNNGIVNDLQTHTVGASISHNSKILEIIPQDDDLVVEAFVRSNDIDSIKVGKKVKIQLSAFKTRTTPRIEGVVLSISADKFDKEVGRLFPVGFYKVKIDIPQKEINKINTIVQLIPGMPVIIFIIKGTRTLAGYLYSPIKDSFHKAFKEV